MYFQSCLPLPVLRIQLPLPLPPLPITTGFKPVTCSASSALNSVSYWSLPLTSPFTFIKWSFSRRSCIFCSRPIVLFRSSSSIARWTHCRHLALSFFASWLRLKSEVGRDSLQELQMVLSIISCSGELLLVVLWACCCFNAAAWRSLSSCAAMHDLHLSSAPVFLYRSRACEQQQPRKR